MAPLRWVGLLDSSRTVSARLFSNYKELSGAPFTAFRLTIKSRTPDGPDVLAAVARIELKVGFFRRILYFLRPYSIVGALLGIGAVAAVLGGFGTAGLCLALLAYAVFWAGGRASGDTDISDASSTLSDLLSAPSSAATTPRDMESDDEDAAPGTHVTASPLVSPRPPDKPWQQLLKQLPLSKLRPATGEDTAYMGSEAAGTSSAASTLRQRRGGS